MMCVRGVMKENKITPDDCSVTKHLPHGLMFNGKLPDRKGINQRHSPVCFIIEMLNHILEPIWKHGKIKKHAVMYLVPIKHREKSRRSPYNWLECVYTCLPPVQHRL